MHITVVKADVVFLVEDGKSTFCVVSYVWQMLLPGGDGIPPGRRLADVIAK